MEKRTVKMQEKWLRWNPTDIPEGEYIVTSVIQDAEGTKIILEDDKNIVMVFFDGITPLVRTSIEGIRIRTWGAVQKIYNDKSFFRNWFLYQVENSQLSNWVSEESCGVYDSSELLHYCIVTGEDLIDVISTFEPKLYISLENSQ